MLGFVKSHQHVCKEGKTGKEASQQGKDLGKICTEGDRNAWLRSQPPSPGKVAQMVT